MNPNGRKANEKLWESKFRHSFFTNYLQDPDLHMLLFTSGEETNSIMREALRDYIAKHQLKAGDPEFQNKVFMGASMQVARGHRPTASEVMGAMGELDAMGQSVASAVALQRGPSNPNAPSPVPAPVIQHTSAAMPAPVMATHAQAHSEYVQTSAPSGATSIHEPNDPPPLKAVKPRVVLDFGAEPTMDGSNDPLEANKKVSQRDKWLARHQN